MEICWVGLQVAQEKGQDVEALIREKAEHQQRPIAISDFAGNNEFVDREFRTDLRSRQISITYIVKPRYDFGRYLRHSSKILRMRF